MRLRCQSLEYQLRGDRDRWLQRTINRTSVGKETVDPAGGLSVGLLGRQLQDHMDTADHEHVVLQLNFTDRFRHQSLVRGVYLTRLQRASEGSSQSTRRSGDNVIQGCSVGLQDRRRNLVMLRHGAMYSEYYGYLFGRKIRPAQRALYALNAHMGPVNHLRHDDRMVSRKSALRKATRLESGGWADFKRNRA